MEVGEKNRYLFGKVDNLVLFQKFEEFVEYFFPIIDRFPKTEKFALVSQIKNICYEIQKSIISANRLEDKRPGWNNVDISLEMLRFFVRHSRKRKFLSPKSYETAEKKLAEVGRIIGGLMRG